VPKEKVSEIVTFLRDVVTSVPLVWFTSAVRKLTYSSIGLLQYLSPTLQFALAVFLYGEPFTVAHRVTFGFIWTGLAIFMADSLYKQRRYARS
jgi:chloramphenicol-sensitive protein RarD